MAKTQDLLISDTRMQLAAARKDAARHQQSHNKAQALIKQATSSGLLLECVELGYDVAEENFEMTRKTR